MADDNTQGAGNSANVPENQTTTTDQQQPAADQAPAPEQQSEIPVIDLATVSDPDMQDYYQAQAEIGAVKLAGAQDQQQGTGSEQAPQGGEQQPEQQGQQDQERQPDKATIMVPKPRLDEVLTRAERAEQDAAFWRGVAQARGEVMQQGSGAQPGADANGGTTEQPKQQTPDEMLAALAAEEDAIAERYDAGDISEKEKTQLLRDVRNREFEVRKALLAPPPQQPAQTVTVDDVKRQLEAEKQESQLYEQHPYAALVFPAQAETDPSTKAVMDARRSMVKAEARDALLRDHPGISGPQADAMFRDYLARTADKYGPAWFGEIKGKASPQAGGTGQMSPAAQDRLNKMGVQRQQPADIGNLGTSQGAGDEWTSDRIAALSDDQYAALPEHIRARFR